jgi:hypothetical protein
MPIGKPPALPVFTDVCPAPVKLITSRRSPRGNPFYDRRSPLGRSDLWVRLYLQSLHPKTPSQNTPWNAIEWAESLQDRCNVIGWALVPGSLPMLQDL